MKQVEDSIPDQIGSHALALAHLPQLLTIFDKNEGEPPEKLS
jgi:hypothetical protein